MLPGTYRIKIADGRSTEELVHAGNYGYAHSCIDSENFPSRQSVGRQDRQIQLLQFDRPIATPEIIREAATHSLVTPLYEDALYFGIAHPQVQLEGPLVFLHDPWHGFFGRRDVLCLWANAGRRELGLEGYDEVWGTGYRFAFVNGQ